MTGHDGYTEHDGYTAAETEVGMTGTATLRRIGKTRGPVAVWLLSLVTLGIYYLVWYYKINRELVEFDSRIQVSPGWAVIAITIGDVIIVPPIVSIWRTGGRIAMGQQYAGIPPTCSGGLGFLLSLVLGLNTIYYQSQLNEIWAVARRTAP